MIINKLLLVVAAVVAGGGRCGGEAGPSKGRKVDNDAREKQGATMGTTFKREGMAANNNDQSWLAE